MGQEKAAAAEIHALQDRIARIGRSSRAGHAACLPFGIPAIDAALPGGGLALGALHEFAAAGAEAEHGTAATLLIAGILARLSGPVLWVQEHGDLFAPALDAVGLATDRVVHAEAREADAVLSSMEEGLRHAGLAGVVGEVSGRLTLTASRRLQLAAENAGVTCFALRRQHGEDVAAENIAAVTRWRVSMLPSPPPLAHAPDTPGIGPPLWRLDLLRCRGGEAASWTVEASDATGHCHLPADLADRPAAAPLRRRRADG